LPYLYAGYTQGFLRFWRYFSSDGGDASQGFFSAAIPYGLYLLSGLNLHALAGESFERYLAGRPTGGFPSWMAATLALGTLGYVAWRAIQRSRSASWTSEDDALAVLAIWLWVPLLFDTLPWATIYPHYLVVLYPAGFLALAVGLRAAWLRAGSPLPRGLLVLVVALIAGWQVYELGYLYQFVDQYPTAGGHGLPAHYYTSAAQRLEALAQEQELSHLIILTDGNDTTRDTVPAVLDWLLAGYPDRRFVDGQRHLVFPPEEAPVALLCWPTVAEQTQSLVETYGSHLPAYDLDLRQGQGTVRYYVWPARDPDLDLALTVPPGLVWTNGVALLGAEAGARQADILPWRLWWEVRLDPPPDAHYQWFNHLIGADGRKAGQQDGNALAPANWRQGESVLSWSLCHKCGAVHLAWLG
jgi:hypothetical protein